MDDSRGSLLSEAEARMTVIASALRETSPITLDDVALLAARRGQPAETLESVVRLIRERLATDVCSVYLIEPDRATLVLAATVGLRPDSVGRVRMALNEGLAGLVAEELRPVMVEDGPRHPRFKYFEEAGEESFHSFLGVPLIDQGVILGVLVVQTSQPRLFRENEIEALTTSADLIAPLVCEARALDQFIAPTYDRIWALARNVWWSWDTESSTLFRELDPEGWRASDHNPIALLSQMTLDEIDRRADQLVLHSRLNYAYRRLQEYLQSSRTWGARHTGVLKARPIAYFSAEFGLHESLPIYSGGLGVLAGDHVKSASDLGVPLVGVGLFYAQGYFRQRLDQAGWQHEDYLDVDTRQLPLELLIGPDNRPVTVGVETRGATISARVWKVSVGRNTLLLLDSDVESNTAEDRQLTARLYGGDTRVRIRQELLLGVGGLRALKALSIVPGVLHLNEGHSAFAALEMIRTKMVTEGIGFEEALRRVSTMTVFTTHTPVPAGHDRFSGGLIEEHLGPLRESLGLSHESLMGLGRGLAGRPRRDVLHDRAGLEKLKAGQRRLVAARSGFADHVDAALPRHVRGEGADWPHHQRRPRSHLARAPDAWSVRPPPRPRVGAEERRAGGLGRDRGGQRRRALGDAPGAQGEAAGLRPPPGRLPRRAKRRAEGGRGPLPADLEPRCDDHRLRAPVRHI
jgi:glycogen phosphorylase